MDSIIFVINKILSEKLNFWEYERNHDYTECKYEAIGLLEDEFESLQVKIHNQVEIIQTGVKDLAQNSVGDQFKNIENIVNKHENIISQIQSKNEIKIKQAMAKNSSSKPKL